MWPVTRSSGSQGWISRTGRTSLSNPPTHQDKLRHRAVQRGRDGCQVFLWVVEGRGQVNKAELWAWEQFLSLAVLPNFTQMFRKKRTREERPEGD